jgi:nucleoside-diphosphate-sugar epimerase
MDSCFEGYDMKVLIIGGTGLISTAITSRLLARGDEVTHFNRGKSARRFTGPVTRIVGDRTDYAAFEDHMIGGARYDCVIDMIGYEAEDASSAVRTFRGRTGHFIFCSTVDVYAKPASVYPVTEDEPRRPISGYAVKKVLCEDILTAAHAAGDLAVTIMRPAYTYGAGAQGIIHSLGFHTSFLDRIRKGLPIIVHGNGTSLWNPCHVDDVARAFVNAAGNPGSFGRAYNVTGEEAISWNQFTVKIAEAMGAPLPALVHIPTDLLALLAPKRAQLSLENLQYSNIHATRAARADLGYRYTVSVVAGMRRTITWLADHNKIESSESDPLYDHLIDAWRELSARAARGFAGLAEGDCTPH